MWGKRYHRYSGEVSVLPHVLPTPCDISARKKQRLPPTKKFDSPSVRDEKKISASVSPPDRDFSELSENSHRPARFTGGYTLPSCLFRSRRASFLCEFTVEIFRSVWITIGGEYWYSVLIVTHRAGSGQELVSRFCLLTLWDRFVHLSVAMSVLIRVSLQRYL